MRPQVGKNCVKDTKEEVVLTLEPVSGIVVLYWNGQLVWTPALSTLFVGVCIQRELSPTSGYTGISARRRYAMFFYLQSVPTRSLSTLVG